jgi:hypothetical protein
MGEDGTFLYFLHTWTREAGLNINLERAVSTHKIPENVSSDGITKPVQFRWFDYSFQMQKDRLFDGDLGALLASAGEALDALVDHRTHGLQDLNA